MPLGTQDVPVTGGTPHAASRAPGDDPYHALELEVSAWIFGAGSRHGEKLSKKVCNSKVGHDEGGRVEPFGHVE